MPSTPKTRPGKRRRFLEIRRSSRKARINGVEDTKLWPNRCKQNIHCIQSNVRDFVIPLDSVDDLAKKYRGTYKLNLRGIRNAKRGLGLNRCAGSIKVERVLMMWEEELNKKSKSEPIIKVENLVDDCLPPENFEYILENVANCDISEMFNENYCVGCTCERCTPKGCSCASTDGSKFAYDRAKRILIEPGLPVFECRKTCKCSKACPNRVVQQGRTVKVMIFRTPDGRGWGVKTLEFIRKNQFVLEYVGEIITSEEAERRGKLYDAAQQTYLFDLDLETNDASYTIDAYRYGNASHFINHSCDPNLRVYGVYIDCIDARLPRLGFFAVRDIPVGEELTFDYQVSNDVVTGTSPMTPSKFRDKSPQLKKFLCACGAKSCRKYMF